MIQTIEQTRTHAFVDTAELIEKFPMTVKKYCSPKSKGNLEEITEHVHQVAGSLPGSFEKKELEGFVKARRIALRRIVGQYLHVGLEQHFPVIDEQLFKLKRVLYLERSANGGKDFPYRIVKDRAWTKPNTGDKENPQKNAMTLKKITIPLFAYAPVFKSDGPVEAVLGQLSVKRRNSFGDITSRKVWLTAELPGEIEKTVKNAFYEALSAYFSIISTAMKTPEIGAVLAEESPMSPEAAAIWIPTPDSLDLNVTEELIYRRPRDPALVLNVFGKKYLVKTWEIKDEEPFEHYLREFTTGALQERLKK